MNRQGAKAQRVAGIFHGWWIVLTCSIGLLMGFAPVILFTFGTFLKPITTEFGWSRGEASLAVTLASLMSAVSIPCIGRLVDRFGAKSVILPAICVFGLALSSLFFLSESLVHLYSVFFILGIAGAGTTPVPYFSVVLKWFDRRRGLALGLTMSGLGLGTFLMPALVQVLIDWENWRWAYAVLGILVISVSVPVVALFLIESPREMGLLPDGEVTAEGENPAPAAILEQSGLSVRMTLRSRTFWLMLVAFFLMGASGYGCLTHMVPMLTDRGVSAQSAALVTSTIGSALFLGRIGTGYLLDRFFGPYLAAIFFVGAGTGVVLLLAGLTGVYAFTAAFLIGLGIGAEADIIAYLVSRYFGLRNFGEIFGYASAAYACSIAAGPLVMGFGFDLVNSYTPVLALFVASTVAAAAVMLMLGPYPDWKSAAQ